MLSRGSLLTRVVCLTVMLFALTQCVHDEAAVEVEDYEKRLWSEALEVGTLKLELIEFYRDLNQHLDTIVDRRSAERSLERFSILERKLQVLGRRVDLLPPARRTEFDASLRTSEELKTEIVRMIAGGQRISKLPEVESIVSPRMQALRRVR